MNKFEEYSNYIKEYLKNNPGDIKVKITPEVRYLLCQYYLLGYNDALSESIKAFKSVKDSNEE